MLNHYHDRRPEVAMVLGVFIIFTLISIAMPLTGDDLTWGVSSLARYWHWGSFNVYDGRYLGNTMIIVLSKIPWLLHIVDGHDRRFANAPHCFRADDRLEFRLH